METSGGTDTVGVLNLADGSRLRDDDSGPGSNFRIAAFVESRETHFVEVRGYDGETGPYVLHAAATEADTGRIVADEEVTLSELEELEEEVAERVPELAQAAAELVRIVRAWGVLEEFGASVITCRDHADMAALFRLAIEIEAAVMTAQSPAEALEALLLLLLDMYRYIDQRLRLQECAFFPDGAMVVWAGEARTLDGGEALDDDQLILVWGAPVAGVPVRQGPRSQWWVGISATSFAESAHGMTPWTALGAPATVFPADLAKPRQ